MGKRKKDTRLKRFGRAMQQEKPQGTKSILRFIFDINSNLNIGGKMSEEGADKAGLQLMAGIKFVLIACSLGIFIALLFWQSPNFVKAIGELIALFRA